MNTTSKARALPLLTALLFPPGCAQDEPDAYGNFEAIEVVVSPEIGGPLIRFDVDEGDALAAYVVAGVIDTTALGLQRRELIAQQQSTRTRTVEAEAQIDVLHAQLATAVEEYERTQRLFNAEAATSQQLNQAEGEVRVLRQRILAARAHANAVREDVGSAQARIDQIEERVLKSRIVNPITGTVLATYVEQGEFVQPGQPLYRIASLDTLILRAYIGGNQLARVQIGQPVTVQFDMGDDELATLPGRVSWISSQAEFTPTPIQTREERTDQVYAIKVRVPNENRVLKIGMPGELVFSGPPIDGENGAVAPAGSAEVAAR